MRLMEKNTNPIKYLTGKSFRYLKPLNIIHFPMRLFETNTLCYSDNGRQRFVTNHNVSGNLFKIKMSVTITENDNNICFLLTFYYS